MALIPGAIPVTGFIGPTDSTDTYAVTDALYGIDGWRNVEDATERDAITAERRRKGMIVGTKDDGNFWKLLTDGPWNYDSTDWELFITGAGPITSGLWENIGGNIVTSSTMFSPGPPHVLPYFDDQQDLGSKLNRWRDLYLGSVVDFSSVLDFVVGGGSPDDSVLRVDNVGLSVYSGKVIRGLASTNYIDLDIAGAFGISTDAGAFANNKFITLGGASGTFSWSDGIGTGSLAIDNTELQLTWLGGFTLGTLVIDGVGITLSHNTGFLIMNNNTYWASGADIRDTSNLVSIDTNIRFLADATSAVSVSWQDRILYDSSGTPSIDWQSRLASDSSGFDSINYNLRRLFDSTGIMSVRWNDRQLVDSLGTPVVDYNLYQLIDQSGNTTVDWDGARLVLFGSTSVDWGANEMYDLAVGLSIDWNNRILYDEAGVNVLRWTGNNIHLYGAALTGTAMNGINMSNTGAAVVITGDTGMTFQSSTGFGLNVDVANLTTLNGSDMNLTSDGFILATAATDSILNMTAASIELSNANASGLININTTNHGLQFGETVVGTRALVYSNHSSALNTSTAPNNYSRVIAGSSGYAGSISQIFLEGRDSTGGYKATIDMNPAAATPVIDFSITSSADFINPHTILRLNGLTYLAEFRDGIGSFTDNSIVMHPTNRELYDSVGVAVINWTNAAAEGIVYDQDYSAGYTARSLVDKEYADAVFVNNNKYVHSGSFTGGTVVTITHGLNTTDVICDVINTATNTKVWGARVDNYLANSIDVTISVTGTYKVVIVG